MEDFNDGVDGKLASRMRRVNPEQFYTLVKMHLSFELDINTEENDPLIEKAKLKKWGLLNFSKKPKSMMNLQQKSPEGGNLTLERISQVRQLIEYLSQEQCISQEGIFRRTGKLTRQQELKSLLYQGHPLKLEDGTYSIHDCASVLKAFLAELPEPLLTELYYPAHCQIAEQCYSDSEANESRLVRSVQLLLLLLPKVNRILLKFLLNLLNKTATFESSNKMNSQTLATLFTPHLMCPRKLSPEALHINSQILSGLVALMIRRSGELFEIPPKLGTDIRAYWVDQERKLLSPNQNNLNESVSDTTDTAHTVFSFVDHKLTAKANTTEDTQGALAQLYAHIQAMPESAKKRRLVKQFNKENGQGTPRHVKQVRTKSLGDSIKKHIFQKKLLGHKKLIDINIGCNINRSNSEENIVSAILQKSTLPPKKLFVKSDDESNSDHCDINNENLRNPKQSSANADSLDSSACQKEEENIIILNDFMKIPKSSKNKYCQSINDRKSSINDSEMKIKSVDENKDDKLLKNKEQDEIAKRNVRRYHSEPINGFLSKSSPKNQSNSIVHKSCQVFCSPRKSNFEIVFTPKTPSIPDEEINTSLDKNNAACASTSPMVRSKIWNAYSAHTSTPSNLLRRNLTNHEYGLTPIANNDKSMSPITHSTTKMTKAMQETMMTPRSRKPVMVVSGTNLCNLASLDENGVQTNFDNRMHLFNIDIDGEDNSSIVKKNEQAEKTKDVAYDNNLIKTNDNTRRPPFRERKIVTIEEDFGASIQQDSMSITSTFREYLLSRSVLTASPVDLSFTSRTGDFEPSESDLNILNEEGLSTSLMHCLDGNNPSSDTSGVVSGSTNSANNSGEKMNDTFVIPRKRGTNLQRNDSKRSVKSTGKPDEFNDDLFIEKDETNISDSSFNSENSKDTFQETSF